MRAVTTGGAAAAALALTAGLGLAACSSSSSSSSSAAPARQRAAQPSASAARAPAQARRRDQLRHDPDHAPVRPRRRASPRCPSSLQALYNGYPTTVYKSAFASWKPKSADEQDRRLPAVRDQQRLPARARRDPEGMLKSAGYTVDAVTSSDEVTDQVADFNQMVEKKVGDDRLRAALLDRVHHRRGHRRAAGIPSISVLNSVGTADTISVGANDWLQGAQMAAQVATDIGGTGKVLDVHGISGVGIDIAAFDGRARRLRALPRHQHRRHDLHPVRRLHRQERRADLPGDPPAEDRRRDHLRVRRDRRDGGLPGRGQVHPRDRQRLAWRTASSPTGTRTSRPTRAWASPRPRRRSPPRPPRSSATCSRATGVKISAIVLNTPLVTDANVAQW